MGAATPCKLMSLVRIKREGMPQMYDTVLNVTLDIVKDGNKKRTAIRVDLASLQGVFTLSCFMELAKVGEKLSSFSQKKQFLQPGLVHILDSNKRKDGKASQILGKEGEEVYDEADDFDDAKFMSCRGTNQNMLASFMQSFVETPNGTGALTKSPNNSNHTAEAKEELKSVAQEMKDSELDLQLKFQGVYIAFLKEPLFDTDKLFSWVSNLNKNQRVEFYELLYPYFLLRVEEVKVILGPKTETRNIEVGALDITDFIPLDSGEGKDAFNSGGADSSFNDRVDIQGLDNDIYQSSLDGSGLESMAEFKSVVGLSTAQMHRYKSVSILQLEPFVQMQANAAPCVLEVRLFSLDSVPDIGIKINYIKLNLELDSFILLKNRKAFYEEIIKTCVALASERNKCQATSFKKTEADLLYEGLDQRGVQRILEEVNQILKRILDKETRLRMMRLFDIKDPNKITQAESPKIMLDIYSLSIRVGGVLDSFTNQSAYLTATTGSIALLMHKSIVLTWKKNIDFVLTTPKEKNTFLTISVEKENVFGMEDNKMIIKITGIDAKFSPGIFEQIMTFIEVIDSKLLKFEYTTKKFQILKGLVDLQAQQKKTYVLYDEELEINAKIDEIAQLLFFPDSELDQKIYFYLGRVTLRIFDEEITKEIVKSANEQRKMWKENLEEWTMVDDESESNNLAQKVLGETERLEQALKETCMVIHLELRPIMLYLCSNKKQTEMLMMVHTIFLMDGMTYVHRKENKYKYQTQFCELFSIMHRQPEYDAETSKKKFDINMAIKHYKEVLRKLKNEGPFINLNYSSYFDHDKQRPVDKISVAVSSITFRFAMQTSKEIFACLIRIIDDTLVRLDAFSETVMKIKKANESDEIRNFKKKKLEVEMQQGVAPKPPKTSLSLVTVKLSTIYLDVFYTNNYRLLLRINETDVTMSDEVSQSSPIEVVVAGVEATMTKDSSQVNSKETDQMKNNKLYFKLLSLQSLTVGITSAIINRAPLTTITICLPTVNDKNLLLVFDVLSLSIFVDIAKTVDKLMEDAKKRTKYLFRDLTEYKSRPPVIPNRPGLDEFEPIGFKYQEFKNLRKQFECFEGSYLDSKESMVQMKDKTGNSLEDSDVFAPSAQSSQIYKPAVSHLITSSKPQTTILGPGVGTSSLQGQRLIQAQQILEDYYIEQIGNYQGTTIFRLSVDKVTVNVYQKFDIEHHSYVTLKILDTMLVAKTMNSTEKTKRGDTTITTSSLLLSIRSLRVLDNTTNSMFKYLLKIPKHSLCLFVRSRETSEKYVKNEADVLSKKTYVIESKSLLTTAYKDKVALILDMKPLMVFIDDKSVKSLTDFTKQLLELLQSDKKPVIENSATNESGPEHNSAEPTFLVDYIALGPLSVQLTARSSTNLSLANFIPDININLEVSIFLILGKVLRV